MVVGPLQGPAWSLDNLQAEEQQRVEAGDFKPFNCFSSLRSDLDLLLRFLTGCSKVVGVLDAFPIRVSVSASSAYEKCTENKTIPRRTI